eukprot:g64244.t1
MTSAFCQALAMVRLCLVKHKPWCDVGLSLCRTIFTWRDRMISALSKTSHGVTVISAFVEQYSMTWYENDQRCQTLVMV